MVFPFTMPGTVSNDDRFDYFRFTVPQSSPVVFTLGNFGSHDLDLIVSDDTRTVGLSLSLTPSETVRFQASAGTTYYVAVSNLTTSAGTRSYTLTGAYDRGQTPAPTPPPAPQPPPPPPPTPQSDSLTFRLTDRCNDGYRINYKFYDVANNRVWPSASEIYYTQRFGETYTHRLACLPNAQVCYGAETGNRYWGVDVDNSEGCTDCCYRCGDDPVATLNLACN